MTMTDSNPDQTPFGSLDYQYVARDPMGQPVKGIVSIPSMDDLIRKLIERGYTPVAVHEYLPLAREVDICDLLTKVRAYLFRKHTPPAVPDEVLALPGEPPDDFLRSRRPITGTDVTVRWKDGKLYRRIVMESDLVALSQSLEVAGFIIVHLIKLENTPVAKKIKGYGLGCGKY